MYEIEIRGYLAEAPGHGVAPEEVRSPTKVIAEIEALAARGERVALVTIDSPGGLVDAALAVYGALRRFSEAGGTVVTYIAGPEDEQGRPRCASTATVLALAGDIRVMHPGARFTVHSMFGGGAAAVEKANRRMLGIYAARTRTPAAELETWLALVENDRGEPCKAEIEADAALAHGWAHIVGDEEAARLVSAAAAARGAENFSGPSITAGAKLDHVGTSLKCAVDGVRFGATLFSNLWSWGWQRCNASLTRNNPGTTAYYLLSTFTGAARSASFIRGVAALGSTSMALKVTAAGHYLVSWRGSFSQDITGTISVAIAKNGTVDTTSVANTRSEGGLYPHHLSSQFYMQLAANDQVELAWALAASGNFACSHLEMILTRLPD